MDNYTITLPNDKAGTYKVVTLIIAIINLLGFLFTRVGISVEDSGYYFSGAGFFVILVPLTKYLFFKKDRLQTLWQILFGIIIGSFCWFFLQMYAACFLNLIFAVTGYSALKKIKITLNKNGIVYPSFPPKKIKWSDVERTMLKDNILTVDLKNNKLIQFRIKGSENEVINENEFNLFCKQYQQNQ